MDFSASEADVDMIHDDALLDINLASHYGATNPALLGNGLADTFIAGMIPGVAPISNQHSHHHNGHGQSNQMQPQPQGFTSVEEYAALMGIKLEGAPEEMQQAHMQPQMNQFANGPDPSKIQANAAYFENLYRERAGMMNGGGSDVTSMTLPAGVGSGINSSNMFVNPQVAAPHHASAGGYDRSTELAFNNMNHRMYDPTTGYNPNAPMGAVMHKPATHRIVQHPVHDLGAQTLSPEILSAMIKNNQNPTMQSYESVSEDERAAILKEEKSRERNRDHSRKSRLRKKEFVENLKQEVEQLHIYKQICEHSQDLIAMITSDPKAMFIYTSASHGRVLGFQPQHLVPGQTSFLDLVHPESVAEVRAIFQKLDNIGDSHRFRFRIRSIEGETFNAETVARMAETGIVCSTRVDRHF